MLSAKSCFNPVAWGAKGLSQFSIQRQSLIRGSRCLKTPALLVCLFRWCVRWVAELQPKENLSLEEILWHLSLLGLFVTSSKVMVTDIWKWAGADNIFGSAASRWGYMSTASICSLATQVKKGAYFWRHLHCFLLTMCWFVRNRNGRFFSLSCSSRKEWFFLVFPWLQYLKRSLISLY